VLLLPLLLLCRAMQLFAGGYEVTQLEGQGDELYVHRKALKAMHVLFDMEVRCMLMGKLLQALLHKQATVVIVMQSKQDARLTSKLVDHASRGQNAASGCPHVVYWWHFNV
jgi:hypothetical protein